MTYLFFSTSVLYQLLFLPRGNLWWSTLVLLAVVAQRIASRHSLRAVYEDRMVLVLGALVALLPAFAPGGLLLLTSTMLLLHRDTYHTGISWGGAWLMVLASWALAAISAPFFLAPATLSSLWHIPFDFPILSMLESWRAAPPDGLGHINTLFRYGALFGLISLFSASRRARTQFRSGVVTGLALAGISFALSTVLQLAPAAPSSLDHFWRAQGRLAGWFSDPNACGVTLFLLSPVVLWSLFSSSRTTRMSALVAALALVIMGLWSGSRTFMAGFALLALWYCLRQPRARTAVVLLVSTCAALVVLASAVPAEMLPPALARTAQTLNPASSLNALFSRSALWQMGFEAWLQAPLLGIGPSAFLRDAPFFAAHLAIPIGLWSDNPNNYYLAIAVGTGLLGIIALLLAIAHLHRQPLLAREERSYQIVAMVFLVLLALGPHLDFVEVTIVSAFLVGSVYAPVLANRKRTATSALLSIPVMYHAFGLPFGLYGWERSDATYFRWTRPSFSSFALCHERAAPSGGTSGTAEIIMEIGRPPSVAAITRLAIESGKYSSLAVNTGKQEVGSGGILHAIIDCSQAKTVQRCGKRWVYYRVSSSPGWIPRQAGLGDDRRLLGVRIRANRLEESAPYCRF